MVEEETGYSNEPYPSSTGKLCLWNPMSEARFNYNFRLLWTEKQCSAGVEEQEQAYYIQCHLI